MVLLIIGPTASLLFKRGSIMIAKTIAIMKMISQTCAEEEMLMNVATL